MNPTAQVEIAIPFHDVDMLCIAWHGHYYKYFEIARTELFRKYNCDVNELKELGYYLPITDSSCRYISPLKYGMKVLVSATLAEWEYRFVVKYLIRNAETGKRLAKGSTTQVSVLGKTHSLCMVSPDCLVQRFTGTLSASVLTNEEH